MSTPTQNPADAVLVITRHFNAPRELVFAAWTTPEHLARWSAPKGFTMPEAQSDIQPGGHWHCHMVSPTGEDFRVGGEYLEIVPPELIVMTHQCQEENGPGIEAIVTVRFTEENGGTLMTFEQKGFSSVESLEGHRGGWTECFDKLDQLLADEKKS